MILSIGRTEGFVEGDDDDKSFVAMDNRVKIMRWHAYRLKGLGT